VALKAHYNAHSIGRRERRCAEGARKPWLVSKSAELKKPVVGSDGLRRTDHQLLQFVNAPSEPAF
jgi:hypothetical protein